MPGSKRAKRNVTPSDATIVRLMEAHANSRNLFYNAQAKSTTSDLLTAKNFGERTGLPWSEEEVEREVAK